MRPGILGLLGGLGVVALLFSLSLPTAPPSAPPVPRPWEGEMLVRPAAPEVGEGTLSPETEVSVSSGGPPARSVDETSPVMETAPGLYPSAQEQERMEREGVMVY